MLNAPARTSASKLEPRLISILTDLAVLLLKGGYGISGLSKIAKRAYVDAAIALSEGAGHKRSLAQIAAATGLTRSEVAQLSHIPATSDQPTNAPTNRAQRVSFGWIRDAQFCDSAGKPKALPFVGGQTSFATLVKKYSGDIPARAMFVEMRRLGMVRAIQGDGIELIRADSTISREALASLRAMSPWIGFLAEAGSSESRDLNANTVRLDLNFESLPQLFAAVRDIQDRGSAFVNGISELGSKKPAGHPHKLNVSIALATRVPRQEVAVRKRRRSTPNDRSSIEDKNG